MRADADHLAFVQHDDRSASMTVLTRWATMKTVASAVSCLQRRAQPGVRREVERREAVVEARRPPACRTRARAMESRCFWPPDRLVPPCEIGDSKPLWHRVDELAGLRDVRGVPHLIVGRRLACRSGCCRRSCR